VQLASNPVCLHLLGRFGDSVWLCWSPLVAGWWASGQAAVWKCHRVEAWQFHGAEAWWPSEQWSGFSVGQRPGRPVSSTLVGLQGGGLVGLQGRGLAQGGIVGACLFFQCIVTWRILPGSRGSGCWSFSSHLCFTSSLCVSTISARSLIHGAHSLHLCHSCHFGSSDINSLSNQWP
jgi:hypothetical protein